MVALITGGSSGMGLEFARQLAGKGYDLILVSNRPEELSAAAAELSGVQVRTREADLALPDAADRLDSWLREEGVLPDILVNNAGMFFFKELQPQDLDRVQAMLNLHIGTVTRLCILLGARMKERGSGYILNMSSMAARIPAPGITVYSATKAYLLSFGKSLYHEMRPYGVGVTTVCPAAIATPLYRLDPQIMALGVRLRLIHTPQWLVRRALQALFHHRRCIQPSVMNAYLPALIGLLPNKLVQYLWKKWK